jgi:hypothetical protein
MHSAATGTAQTLNGLQKVGSRLSRSSQAEVSADRGAARHARSPAVAERFKRLDRLLKAA